MNTKRQIEYCRTILNRIQRIEETALAGYAAFLASHQHQDAVIRNFEVIGEVVKRLDATIVAAHPHIPWTDFAGFRDFLIHRYDEVDLASVWASVLDDLPDLKAAITIALQTLEQSPQ